MDAQPNNIRLKEPIQECLRSLVSALAQAIVEEELKKIEKQNYE